ncbi:hypothetical protein SAMN05443575_1474 [Jatrophihabitans endophyticus]|uniref:Uncharacterized protein n=1 Tax=Jatrophihabitans endophyticus TaxID=1206085 RepID=A0A1M5HCH6_9ACTN|nr:hypothetical protein [Jatrophihabitans endophyticus]SHG13637.1 hypothetical protein SAMN05443575_1474 [Jatrophihabitans endophyticus]
MTEKPDPQQFWREHKRKFYSANFAYFSGAHGAIIAAIKRCYNDFCLRGFLTPEQFVQCALEVMQDNHAMRAGWLRNTATYRELHHAQARTLGSTELAARAVGTVWSKDVGFHYLSAHDVVERCRDERGARCGVVWGDHVPFPDLPSALAYRDARRREDAADPDLELPEDWA